jgi:HEPN domain-containing protein
MKDNLKGAAKAWFKKSKQDLETGKLLLKSGGYPDTICYFAHQAVEKSLKGYLVANDIKPEKIHNLIKLAAEVEKLLPQIKNFQDEIAVLNDYYIPTKYPIDVPVEYSKTDTKDALKFAESIIVFIQNDLKR